MQSLMRLGMCAVASAACCAAVSAGDVAIQDLTPMSVTPMSAQDLTPMSAVTPMSADTAIEHYGTSWMRDLMTARQFAPEAWAQRQIKMNGATDANHAYTPLGHATHDLGMAMDIGINDLVSRGQSRANEPLLTIIANYAPADPTSNPLNRWSNTNASALLALLSREADNNQQAALGNFFSLYAMTQSGANGSRDALRAQIRTTPQDQADTVLNALFGGGTQATGLISKVHIGGTAALGQNPYLNINNALAKLGVSSTPVDFHHNHFHVYLRPPVLRGLPNMLEASQQLPLATVSG